MLASDTEIPGNESRYDHTSCNVQTTQYASLTGVKVINVETNRLVAVLGASEASERFVALALFQGTPKVDSQMRLAAARNSQLRAPPKRLGVWIPTSPYASV